LAIFQDRRLNSPSLEATPDISTLAQTLIQVPDKLAVVQMHLQQLADARDTVPGAPFTLAEVCNLLHSATIDVGEVARALHALSALDQKCESGSG
jgi:hypothetical protein